MGRQIGERAVRIVSLVCVLSAAIGGWAPAAGAASDVTSRFAPLDPVRVLDTRTGLGALAGVRGAASSTTLALAGHSGVPLDATAVVLNVTVADAGGPGFVAVVPAGQAPGATSNLNIERAVQTTANLVVVRLGAGGAVSLFMQTGGHLVADLFGYFAPTAAATAGRFVALDTPTRLADTRDLSGVPVVNPGDTVNCGDFASWADANRWFWTYHRYGDIGRLDQNGDNVPCEALAGAAKVAQPPADLFKVPAQGSLRLPVTVNAVIPGGLVPAGASAVVVNVTATAATGAGFVQVIATGGSTGLGASSNLNVEQAGQTIANLSIVPIGADGTITIYAQAGAHLVVDVAGYFTGTGAPASTGGLFVPVDPTRLIDTRNPPATKPGPGTPVVVTAGGVGGIPTSGVAAVFLNVTITDAEAPGYVTVYPGGVALPTVSNVNAERAGQTKPNAAFTGLGTGGVFNLYTQTGGHLLADAAGWFTLGTVLTPPPPPGGTVAEQLAGLRVAVPDFFANYDRADWGYPADIDGDCQDTRAEVLQRDSLTAVGLSVSRCTVTAGSWLDPYTTTKFTDPTQIEIDHVVPLANANYAGGWRWDHTTKVAYANDLTDPHALVAVSKTANQAKGASGPDQWKPPSATAWCRYGTWWIAIKTRWQLTISQNEHDALANMITTCP